MLSVGNCFGYFRFRLSWLDWLLGKVCGAKNALPPSSSFFLLPESSAFFYAQLPLCFAYAVRLSQQDVLRSAQKRKPHQAVENVACHEKYPSGNIIINLQ